MTNRAINAGDTAIPKPAWHHISAFPATRLATCHQRRRALWACIGIVLATLLLFPLAAFMGPPVPAFFPSYQTATVVAYVTITHLIFAHYRAARTLDLLYIGGGCFYCAGILIVQFLALPDMFLPQRSVLGGTQTTIWLWVFWHAGMALDILLYAASLRWSPVLATRHPERMAQLLMAVVVVALMMSLVPVVVFHEQLPQLEYNGNFHRMITSGVGPFLQFITAFTLLILWQLTRFKTVLQV